MENLKIINLIAQDINVDANSVQKAVTLFQEGHTIPFVARYRKKETDYLDENNLTEIFNKLTYYKNLTEKKENILQELSKNDFLTNELKTLIENAKTISELEALYKPYKKKKVTKAQIALKLGLREIADFVKYTKYKKDKKILAYSDNDKLTSYDEILKFIGYIIENDIFENSQVRAFIKEMAIKKGQLQTKKKNDNNTYKNYYDFFKPVKYLEHYQVLAVLRAEKEKVISYKIALPYLPVERVCRILKFYPDKAYYDFLYQTVETALKDKVLPSVQNEIISELKEKAIKRALIIFGKNIGYLLFTPPLSKKSILGIDPGYRNGCKIALIDKTGELVSHAIIYPAPPQNDFENSEKTLLQIYNKHPFDFIAIGNGTASYETEMFIQNFLEKHKLDIQYSIVSEAGSSVYSVSKVAVEEFPHISPNIRSAISIARKTQSPMNELVKIPPESIGVGMYQHDLPQKELKNYLKIQVENTVSKIGINLNTASFHLLKYISGFSEKIAKNIIEYRKEKKFSSRDELKKVKGIGKQTFLLSAGFCRVPTSDNFLDNTIIHPESYKTAYNLVEKLGFNPQNIKTEIENIRQKLINYKPVNDDEKLIKEALLSKNSDPRENIPNPKFNRNIKSINDLAKDMILNGMIKNIVDFGIFVDIGTKENGLIYKTELPKDFYEHYFVGQIIKVQILDIDINLKRLALKPAD